MTKICCKVTAIPENVKSPSMVILRDVIYYK